VQRSSSQGKHCSQHIHFFPWPSGSLQDKKLQWPTSEPGMPGWGVGQREGCQTQSVCIFKERSYKTRAWRKQLVLFFTFGWGCSRMTHLSILALVAGAPREPWCTVMEGRHSFPFCKVGTEGLLPPSDQKKRGQSEKC
jgi:hypothetical protein